MSFQIARNPQKHKREYIYIYIYTKSPSKHRKSNILSSTRRHNQNINNCLKGHTKRENHNKSLGTRGSSRVCLVILQLGPTRQLLMVPNCHLHNHPPLWACYRKKSTPRGKTLLQEEIYTKEQTSGWSNFPK